MFSDDFTKLVITFADVDRYYRNLVICLQLDVTLSAQKLAKI